MKEHDVEHRGVLEAIFLKGGAEVLLGAFAERYRFKKSESDTEKTALRKRFKYTPPFKRVSIRFSNSFERNLISAMLHLIKKLKTENVLFERTA